MHKVSTMNNVVKKL